jgi:aquaporin Z
VQFGGAALAALLLDWVLPESAAPNLGAPTLNEAVDTGQGVTIEAVLTFFLVWVIFATVVDERGTFRQVAGLAIGLVITFGTLMAAALTGAAMNPARAFGPELVANFWDDWWVWFVGPFAGAVIAAVLYELLFLRSPEPAGMAAQAAAGEPLDPVEPGVFAASEQPADEPDEPRASY